MDKMKVLIPCCFAVDHDDLIGDITDPAAEKFGAYTDTPSAAELQSAAQDTSHGLIRYITTTDALNTLTSSIQMQEIITSGQPITISSSRWTRMVLEKLYKAMIELVTKAGELKQELSPVMHKVLDEAKHFAQELAEFQDEHPILAVVIETTALAVLIALLAPFLLEALGFGVEGVAGGRYSVLVVLSTMLLIDNLTGSLAAKFQALYPDVPYGSLFSKLQSFAARYGKSLLKH
jgi:hypothetical protein